MSFIELAVKQLQLIGSPLNLVPFSAPVIGILYVFSELVDVKRGKRFSKESIKDFIFINIWVLTVFMVQFMILWGIFIFIGL